MKLIPVKLCVVTMALVLSACAPSIRVATDYNPSANFSTLRDYAWLSQDKKPVGDPRVDNSLMNQRIEKSVEAQLAKQGFQRANDDKSVDFYVAYHVFSNDKLDVTTTSYGYFGYYPCWYCSGVMGANHDTVVRQYKEGEFIIDFIDPATHSLLWRGSAERRLVTNATPQERETYIREVVEAILLAFPPGVN